MLEKLRRVTQIANLTLRLLLQAECAFGEIFRRWSILAAPLETDLARSILIFRVACKLHHFAIRERDPFYNTYAGLGPPPPADEDTHDLTEGGDPAARGRGGNEAAKRRRHSWMLALKAAGLRRRPRAN